ncbi:MAG: RdgB/HAM1 family non-canonical purine NTP pyrophosphatase [Chloroflexi bacterium]|nr:MAG: RdgB/HAM1 family non-canonical purine NTP pyrophosphatase [Chloroflexota bacterium]
MSKTTRIENTKTLLIATNNKGKLLEYNDLLMGLDLDLISPHDIGLSIEVQEDGETYLENASLKAKAFALASGLTALADDSGLEVDVLGGRPGVYSHRITPSPEATDADRRSYLLSLLKGKPHPWKARFRCIIVIAQPDGVLHSAEGVCEGEIVPQEIGEKGFGYDPIFLFQDYGKTMAELELAEKNQISHRAHAVFAAIPILKNILESN